MAVRRSPDSGLDPSTARAASGQFGDEQESGAVAPRTDAFPRSVEDAPVDVHPVQFSHPPLDGPADRFATPEDQDARSDGAPVFQAAGGTPTAGPRQGHDSDDVSGPAVRGRAQVRRSQSPGRPARQPGPPSTED